MKNIIASYFTEAVNSVSNAPSVDDSTNNSAIVGFELGDFWQELKEKAEKYHIVFSENINFYHLRFSSPNMALFSACTKDILVQITLKIDYNTIEKYGKCPFFSFQKAFFIDREAKMLDFSDIDLLFKALKKCCVLENKKRFLN